MQRSWWWYRGGILILVGGMLWGWALALRAAQETPHSSSAQTEESAAPEERTSLTPEALELIKTAKERLAAEQKTQAQQLAIEVAREKTKQQTLQAREAQRQLELARARQLKTLYAKALSLFRQGSYREAIAILENMVLVDPAHPLVKSAERLLARAELKRFEQQARAGGPSLPSGTKGAVVPDLERLLTQKRMELETTLKYARAAIEDGEYETAMQLLTNVLAQDPNNRLAQRLLEQAKEATLKLAKARYQRQVELDEQAMVNEVVKAQILPESPVTPKALPLVSGAGQGEIATKLQQPISLDFTDVALADVLDFVADASNISVIPSPRMNLKERRVSIHLKDLPLEAAMKYLTRSLSLAYRVDGDAILIASPEEFSNQPLETRVFFLRSGLGPFTLEASAVKPNPALMMESITDLISQSIPQPPGSKLVMDERSGALIMTNTRDHLALMERLLSQLDVTPVQVLIEARFVELTMTELEHLGLESVLNGDVTLERKEDSSGTEGAAHQLNKGGGFKFPTLSREGEALNLTLQGVLTGTQFETVLHLLEETKKTKTLSAPRITALNNQTATIKVVDEFRYPTRFEVSLIQFDINGDGDFDDAGETEFANVPRDFKQRDIGILLNVTPSVGKDLRTITLVLSPEVSSFSQFRDLGGGVTVPEFTSSQVTTSVVLEDGQTVVLGGLMKDTTSEDLTKIPVLGDLPLIGGLFRQREESATLKNLLIFLTARVLGPRDQTT